MIIPRYFKRALRESPERALFWVDPEGVHEDPSKSVEDVKDYFFSNSFIDYFKTRKYFFMGGIFGSLDQETFRSVNKFRNSSVRLEEKIFLLVHTGDGVYRLSPKKIDYVFEKEVCSEYFSEETEITITKIVEVYRQVPESVNFYSYLFIYENGRCVVVSVGPGPYHFVEELDENESLPDEWVDVQFATGLYLSSGPTKGFEQCVMMRSLYNDVFASMETIEVLKEQQRIRVQERTKVFEAELLDRIWSDPQKAILLECIDTSRFGVI
jgi:hypothetical protein